jgi:hypothetical protein
VLVLKLPPPPPLYFAPQCARVLVQPRALGERYIFRVVDTNHYFDREQFRSRERVASHAKKRGEVDPRENWVLSLADLGI